MADDTNGTSDKPVRPQVDRKARFQIAAQRPEKQPAPERVGNWNEVYFLYDLETAKIEAERCIQCPAAPCQKACPVHNDIPAALWELEQGNIDGAANIFRDTSELPEMCGRLCPQERLCEGHCVVGKNALPVAIGKLETFVTERQRAAGQFKTPEVAPATGHSVGIVGAGPAGIAVAERLAKRGHRVVMYDSWPRPGGILRYGIPNFKQNKAAVDRKFQDLRALGIEIHTGVHIGRDLSWSAFRTMYDAVFMGAGAPDNARLGVPNEDAPRVMDATEFLVRANLSTSDLPATLSRPLPKLERVVVIGGGDTSMDCVRSARRLGADEVTLVYRRTESEMQGRIEEREHAREEGVQFEFLASPLAVLINEEGEAIGVRCQRMQLGEADDTGRRRPEPIPGSDFDLMADMVVTAIGYNVDPEWGEIVPDLSRDRWDRLVADPETMSTNLPGVFGGGDIVNGADLVVTALADGHRAAEAIDAYLKTLDRRPDDEWDSRREDAALLD